MVFIALNVWHTSVYISYFHYQREIFEIVEIITELRHYALVTHNKIDYRRVHHIRNIFFSMSNAIK